MRLSLRVFSVVVWAFVVSFGSAGCGGSDMPPALDSYFQAKPYANPACNAVDQRLAGQRQMRLYSRVGAGAMLPVTQGVASYYHRHSLSFFAAEQAQGTTMAYALDTDENALGRALIAAFPGVDFNDDAAVMADPVVYNQIITFAANFILKPMVDFAHAHSDLGAGVTNLILVGQLERPGGTPLGEPGTSLAGLAISPALLAEFARTMPEEAQIWQGVTLPANFTPMLVLGNNVLTRAHAIDPELGDLVAAHEFGHTGALVHSMVPLNLMFPSVSPGIDHCTDSLDDGQLALMAASYGLGPSAALQLKRPAPIAPARPVQPLSSFTPARLRAMLAGDPQATRGFVEMLFHGAARP